MKATNQIALGLLISMATASAVAQESTSLTIVDVTLIDGVADAPRPHMTVRVVDGRIAAVEDAGAPVAGAIDGAGKFLIPGLWDTHAHLSYWGEDALQLLVAAGVTSIRELGGDPDEIEGWQREIEAGERLGPRFVWCGPFLEGPDGGDEYRLTVGDAEAGRAAARELHQRGVDFLKIQPRIDRSVVEAVIDEARKRGLSVVGHLPRGLSAVEGSRIGLRSIEHMDPYTRLDDEQLDEAFSVYREHGTWMSPALYSLAAPVEARGGNPLENPRLKRSYDIVRRAHAAGVPILVGSNFAYRDWPQKPGSGLHGEMRALVDAGISPMDVLKLTTAKAAEFNGVRSGVIRPGMPADMVLLDADPLADIRNTERIVAVILGGRWLTGL